MDIKFRKPVKSDSKEIITWKYEGVYSFYNNDKTEAKKQGIENMYKEDSSYIMCNNKDEILGHCSFDFDEDDREYFLGVQMRPDLVGKGNGKKYLDSILQFGRNKYKFSTIMLLVTSFNKRAHKLYLNLGFEEVERFETVCNDEEVEFIVMKKNY